MTFRFQSTESRKLVAPNHHNNEDNNDRLHIFSVHSSSEDQLQDFRYYDKGCLLGVDSPKIKIYFNLQLAI